MTRFARAKGSKASNERAPEDATPWEVMKEQLLQAKIDGEHAKKRLEVCIFLFSRILSMCLLRFST